MTKLLYVCAIMICPVVACTSSAQQPPPAEQTLKAAPGTNPDAGLIADFRKRVDEYVKLRDKAEGKAPVELKSSPSH